MKGILLNNWRLKLVAVLVSLGLWLYIYNEHNPRFSINHRVSVRYINQEKSLHVKNAPDSIVVEFKGNPDQIKNIDPGQMWAEADLAGLDAGRHTVPVRVVHGPPLEVVDKKLKISLTLERLNSIERTLTVLPVGSLPIDKRLGTVRPSRDVVTFYGSENTLNKVSEAVVSLYLTDQGKSFSVRLPVEARDKFGNVVPGVTAEPEEITVDVAVNNANTRIVPVNLNFSRGLDPSRVVAEHAPVTVTLFGKDSALSSISFVGTEMIDAARCVPGAEFEVNIQLPRSVFSADDTVTITCKEPRTVSRLFTVNLELVNVPQGMDASIEKTKFEVIITGDAVDLDQLKLEQIRAALNLSKFKNEGRHSVKPELSVRGARGDLELEYDESPITVTLKKK